jgi:hypothetical protein
MAPHTLTEMHERIVIWCEKLNKSNLEIAELASCSECTVWEVLQHYRNFGVIQNPFAQPQGGCRLHTMADMNYVTSLLGANPALYLNEL